MHSLRGSLSEEDIVKLWLTDPIHLSNVLTNTFPHKRDAKRVSVAARTDDLVEHSLGSCPCISIHALVGKQIRIEYARDHFPEESNRFLVELLRVADIAECNLVEGVL